MTDIEKGRQVLAAMQIRGPYSHSSNGVHGYRTIGQHDGNPIEERYCLCELIRYPEDARALCWLANNFGAMLDELEGQAATIKALQATLVEERAIAAYKAVPMKNHDHLHRLPDFLQEDWRKKARKKLAEEWPGLDWEHL